MTDKGITTSFNEVIEEGITIFFNDLQSETTSLSIFSMEGGTVISSSELQLLKALTPKKLLMKGLLSSSMTCNL